MCPSGRQLVFIYTRGRVAKNVLDIQCNPNHGRLTSVQIIPEPSSGFLNTLRRRGVTLEMVPLGKSLAASSILMVLESFKSRSSIGTPLMTIPQFGSCVLIPSNASPQSMARSCSACFSVVHRKRIPLVSLLIPRSLTPGMEAFSTTYWHRSVISFWDMVVINSFTSLAVCFVVNVTSHFACS